MKRISLTAATLAVAAIALVQTPAQAQADHPHLHINPRWSECSFQLDASLTKSAWRQFTREAGLVAYFRPLSDARPMGRGRFEVSVVQWQTNIDDAQPAWNDTFVHPDSTHWLIEGSSLAFPGLMVRAGVTERTDVGLYVTKSPGANYGFYGGQLQRNLLRGSAWAAAARVSFVSMYGPEDLDYTVYGADFVASRSFTARWATVSPYAGVSTFLGASSEKSSVVTLDDERVLGAQAMVGAAVQMSGARIGLEYNVASIPTLSLKVGFGR